ncbi:MAG: hypothetical protein JST73_06790, partial [Actinobacteria bacterium]|nr:hypothetical protein [Actinomycetota bacterium]
WARTRAAQFGFIDAKFRSRAGVEALISFARRHRDRALFVSTPNARVLTEIHTGAPWVHTLLSVCNVGRMRSVLGGHVAVAGLYGFSVNQSLLDPTTTAGLVHRAPFVLAYSVDSMARVRNLSDWGVRGITTDSLPIARALSSAARARGARVV